jgi:hypothetical protein
VADLPLNYQISCSAIAACTERNGQRCLRSRAGGGLRTRDCMMQMDQNSTRAEKKGPRY